MTEIQGITGAWFAPAQGGVFAPGATGDLVARLAEWGATGVGQSSWGPAVYGLADGTLAGRHLAGKLGEYLGEAGQVFEGGFAESGARVWRAESGRIR